MCGIFGIMSYKVNNEYAQAQEIATRVIGTEILQLLEERGRDATGVVTLFEDCSYMGLKMGVSATEFLSRFGSTEEDYEGWLDKMRLKDSAAKMFVGHCRKSSVGNSTDNSNNHPIHIHNKLIGVHNGTLKNHDAIFHNLDCKRDGTVDSEGIFRLLYHFLNDGKDPFTKEAILETCRRIHGTYAVITMNSINPHQLAVFRDGRPLAFVLIKKLNLLVIASEEKYLKHAILKYNKLSTLYKLKDNFIRLTKNDIEFKTLTDDSLNIFDNRIEITKDTKLDDLINEEKIPRIDKVWKTKLIDVLKINKKDNVKLIESNVNKYKETSTKNVEQSIFTKNKSCLLWSTKFDKLELIEDDNIINTLGNIEIDTIKQEIFKIKDMKRILLKKYSIETKNDDTDIKEEKQKSIALVKSIEVDTCNVINANKAKIYINHKLHKNSIKNETVDIKIDDKTNIEIDTNFDINTIKISEAFSKYSMDRYSNDAEAMEAIEINSKSIINALPFHSLCNRIKRYVIKEGFYRGYKQRIEDEKDNDIIQLKDKKDKAEKKIRVLKTLSKVLSKIVFDCTKFNIFDVHEDLKNTIKQKQEIDSNTLKSIYSNQDLKDSKNEIISKITTLLELKNK